MTTKITRLSPLTTRYATPAVPDHEIVMERYKLWITSLKPETRKTYTSVIKQFTKQYGDVKNLNDSTLNEFMKSLTHKSENYNKKVLTVLTTLAEKLGRPISADIIALCSERIQSAKKGSCGEYCRPGVKKNAITASWLSLMLDIPDRSGASEIEIRNKTLMLLTYLGGFRINEVLQLRWKDIDTTDDMVKVTLRDWKTAKVGETHTTFIPSKRLVRALHLLRHVPHRAGMTPESPLFFDYRKRNQVPLSYSTARRIVQNYATRAGFTGNIGTHSFRAGYNTDALANGVNPAQIGRVTRQNATTVMSYVDNLESTTTSAVVDLI